MYGALTVSNILPGYTNICIYHPLPQSHIQLKRPLEESICVNVSYFVPYPLRCEMRLFFNWKAFFRGDLEITDSLHLHQFIRTIPCNHFLARMDQLSLWQGKTTHKNILPNRPCGELMFSFLSKSFVFVLSFLFL